MRSINNDYYIIADTVASSTAIHDTSITTTILGNTLYSVSRQLSIDCVCHVIMIFTISVHVMLF